MGTIIVKGQQASSIDAVPSETKSPTRQVASLLEDQKAFYNATRSSIEELFGQDKQPVEGFEEVQTKTKQNGNSKNEDEKQTKYPDSQLCGLTLKEL